MKENSMYKGIGYFLLLVLLSIPLFLKLNYLPIELWDESRLAINAYEMYDNGDYIVTHYEGGPDMWNTKPPLMIWLQVFCMKLFGVSELALRLPSAFAGLFTCLTLLFFLNRYLKDIWLGVAVALILVTMNGYVEIHVTRTGDYDSLLTLFMLLYSLSFFILLETKNNKYLYCFFTFLALSVLTKGIAGLFFLPGLFIYLLCKRQFMYLIKNKNTYIGLVLFLCLTSGYYLLREWNNPGYLSTVSENELGGRFLVSQHDFHFPFYYYFSNMVKSQLFWWLFFVPIGLIVALKSKDSRIKNLIGFSFLLSSIFLLIISFAKTKLYWYNAPTFPFFALMAGVAACFIFRYLKDHPVLNNKFRINFVPYLVLAIFFMLPYVAVCRKVSAKFQIFETRHYLQSAVKENKNMDGYFVICDVYNPQNYFYMKLLHDRGSTIAYKDWDKLVVGDKAIVERKESKELINKRYTFEVLESKKDVDIYKVITIK